jgi:hypothetical protein
LLQSLRVLVEHVAGAVDQAFAEGAVRDDQNPYHDRADA